MRPLLKVMRLEPGERSRVVLSVVLGFGAVMSAAGLLACSGYLITRASQRVEILMLTAVITAVRGFGIARSVFRYGERLASHDLALRVLSRLRAGFYTVLAPLGAAAGGARAGDLLSRFVADVDTLQDLYLRAIAPPVTALLVVLGAGGVAAIFLPAAGLMLAACLLVCIIVIPLITARIAASAGRRQAATRSALTSELVESIDGAVELAVSGRAEERVAKVRELSDSLTRLARRSALASAVATTLATLATGVTVILLLIVTIPAVHDGTLKGVLLAAVVLLGLGAFDALDPLPAAARTFHACSTAAQRLGQLEQLTPAVSDPQDPIAPPVSAALKVSGLAYTYPDGTRVLQHASFSFSPGQRIALTGSSGAGKSTLAQLLVRFIDPSAGRITYGGVDLRQMRLAQVRGLTTFIAQDAHVFMTSIRENLMLANREATEAQLWEALAAVQLQDFVKTLPDGLDTLVGEDGQLLSGGQRQRLTVARGLISQSRFLILDEPTAQLDQETATRMLQAIDQLTRDRGLLVITHRAEAREIFDSVLLLKDAVIQQDAGLRTAQQLAAQPSDAALSGAIRF